MQDNGPSTIDKFSTRRKLLTIACATLTGALSLPGAGAADPALASRVASPVEDLMTEHGVLSRILSIYDEIASRFEKNLNDPDNCLERTAWLVQGYVQGEHERVEELLVFPALSKTGVERQLISVLVEQHKIGGDITDAIFQGLKGKQQTSSKKESLAKFCRAYSRMFRPHAAREDTVVYPALRKVMSADEFVEFSDKVHRLETKMQAVDIENIVKEIQSIEKALGIDDLAYYSARIPEVGEKE